MDPLELVFNTPIPFFGFRVISLISYGVWFLIFFFYARLIPGLSLRRRLIFSLFFFVFQMLISDSIWTLVSNLRWRGYVPPTNETPWLAFQPWPLGLYFHDIYRFWAYLTGFLFAVFNLSPFFKDGWLSARRAWLGYGLFGLYEFAIIFSAPNPLWVDIGLWRLWPVLAAQTGPQVHLVAYFLNDIIARFVFVTVGAFSWLTWKKS